MITLNDIFAGSLLPVDWYVNEGLVTRRFHPLLPLAILNYTDKCTYDRRWDLVTRKCRGLIYNTRTREVLARPFEKFFNYGEPSGPEIATDSRGTAYDKLDGSLGILYPIRETDLPARARGQIVMADNYAVATRGSFSSLQALWATEHWLRYYSDFTPEHGCTYLFEIIYPENRIVLDYGNTEGLFLLDILRNSTGKRYPEAQWPGPRVEELADGVTLEEAMTIGDRDNKEGFVWVEWGSHTRVKVKQEDYVLKHRIVFGLNARSVWDVLSKPDSFHSGEWEEFLASLPDEFREWADEVGYTLLKQHGELKDLAYTIYNDITTALGPQYSRKEFAIEATKVNHRDGLEGKLGSSPLFMILDGKSIDAHIWKMLYPSADWRPGGAVWSEE